MIVACEQCHARFRLDDRLVKPTGSNVRCSRCKHAFRIFPPDPEPEPSTPLTSDLQTEPVPEPPASLTDLPVSDETSDSSASGIPQFTESDLSFLDTDFFNLESLSSKPPADSPDESGKSALSGFGDTSLSEPGDEKVSDIRPDIEPLTLDDLQLPIEEKGLFGEVDLPELPASSARETTYHQIETLNLDDLEKLIDTPETDIRPAENILPDLDSLQPDGWEPDKEVTLEDLEQMVQRSDTSGIEKKMSDALQAFPETPDPTASVSSDISQAQPLPELSDTDTLSPRISLEPEAEPETDSRLDAPAKSSRISTPLLILFLVVLLAGAAYAILTWFPDLTGPFATRETTVSSEEPGNLKIKAYEISSRFLDNSRSGRLFIITGKVRNEYPEIRKQIQIKGTLFNREKVAVLEQAAFCGNVLSNQELSTLPMADIHKRLSNPDGDNGMSTSVQPSQSIPFMIVFSSLPEKLEEFSLEITQSRKSDG